MELENKKEGKEQEKKREKTEIQITVSIQSEAIVSKLVDRVNEGFDHGRVTRKDLVSYLLVKAAESFDQDDIGKIRSQVLTDVDLLEHLLKEARASGVIPSELRDILWKNINLTPGAKKSKKSSTSKVSNVNYKSMEET